MKKINSPSFFIGKGDDTKLISFGSGQPDLPPPKRAFDVIRSFSGFKYGLIQGDLDLRQALSDEQEKSHPDDFIITNGASEAIDLSLRAIFQRGGKVMLPRPYYYSYPYNVEFAHMKPVYYDLVNGKIDWDNFFQIVQQKNILAVMINSPSNPTGTIQDLEILNKIEKITQKLGIYIISDEVYKDLIYDRETYLIKGKNVITINSFSKTYSMCGIRIGYLYIRDKKLIYKIVEMKTHTSMNTSILGQIMAREAMRESQKYIDRQVQTWHARRDLIYNELINLGLPVWKPEGAFYVFPKIGTTAKDSQDAVNTLYYKYNIITYDGSWFGAPGHIRFSYALTQEKIKEGMRRFKKFLSVFQ